MDIGAADATADEIAREAVDHLRGGEIQAALADCRRILAWRGVSLAALDIALWVALTAKADDLAAELAGAVARLTPLSFDRQRTAAGLLAQGGRFGEAIVFAAAASELRPNDFDAAFFLGAIQLQAGQASDAVRSLLRAQHLRPGTAEISHQLAMAASSLGQAELATAMAVESFRLEPASPHRAMFAAGLLRQQGRLAEAIEVLSSMVAEGQDGAHLKRMLSDCLLVAGRPSEALAEINHALTLAPGRGEFLLFRATLLTGTGCFDDAQADMASALAEDPDNLNARRHAITLCLDGGRYEQALQHAAELLRRRPADKEYASCMLHVLQVSQEPEVELPALAQRKRLLPSRQVRRRPTAWEHLVRQGRVTGALMLREMRTRFGESRLGYLWVLVEMGIHLGVLAIVFQVMMHGQPPMGQSFFFFYFTGLLPYLLFLHTSEHAGHAIMQNRHMLQLPMVNNFNVVLSRGLLELFTQLVIGGLFTIGFLIAGVSALPHSFGQASAALLIAWLLGLGWGFINAVLNTMMHAWHHVFSVVIRMLYFCSGIFYVPAAMPVPIRTLLEWNPLLHCVDWFRTTFFSGYNPHWLDREYALVCSLVFVLVGLLLEAGFRRQLRKPV